MSEEQDRLGAAAGAFSRTAVGKAIFVKGAAVLAILFAAYILISGPILAISAQQSNNAATACLPPGNSGSNIAAPALLVKEQIENAKTIDAAAKALGLPGAASRVAIITAYGESTLFNIKHGDLAGPDSRGLFQQRTTQGWGTEAQVMDPTYAATSFLIGPRHDRKAGLVSVAGWEQMDPTAAIHIVQRNSDANHYAKFYAAADSIIKQAGIDINRAGTATAGKTPAVTVGQCGGSGSSKTTAGTNHYPWDAQTPAPGVYVADPIGYFYGECVSYVGWMLNHNAGVKPGGPYKWSIGNGNGWGNAAQWRDAWLARGWKVSTTPVAGAVAWNAAFGGPYIGEAGHVGLVDEVLPDGRVIISEYNNVGDAPPGHKYSRRTVDPSTFNAYLYPPPK